MHHRFQSILHSKHCVKYILAFPCSAHIRSYVPVHCNSQETENRAHKRHAQQRVYHIVKPFLHWTFLLQLPHVRKDDHQVLPGLGEAGDGIEGRQAADEAVHRRVQVPVPHDGHNNQQVLNQAHHTDGEEDREGDLHIGAVWLVHVSRRWKPLEEGLHGMFQVVFTSALGQSRLMPLKVQSLE